jgi:CDP-glycerol glycerophosphotransferase
VWFAQTRRESAQVRATGRAAVWKRSPRGWFLQARAGVAVLGSGPSELNRPLMGRALVVQTWHGAPFKRIHADFPQGDVLIGGTGRLSRLVDGIVRRATNATRRVDLLPSQSPLVSQRFQSAFRIRPEAAPVLGTPRLDVIGAVGPEAEAESREALAVVVPGSPTTSRILLYAPTWRDGRSEEVLAEGFDVGALDALLTARDAILIIKMHPQGDVGVFERTGAGSSDRIILGTAARVDVNVLLRAVDCLLTDYSAISVDYAVLGRPIVYFMPDLEEYDGARGLYESPSALTGGLHCRTWPEALTALEEALTDPGPYVAAAEAAADRYVTHRDAQSCARITAELLVRTGLAPRTTSG